MLFMWSRLVHAGQFEGRPFRFRCVRDALSPKSSAVAKGAVTDTIQLVHAVAIGIAQ